MKRVHARNASRRARNAGFTLVELMVSLVAGLIVTIAVVGLARAATTTFFEAARIASVEATVRTASERLRQDLSRAGYMSTGNIRLARDGVPGVPVAQRIAVNDPTGASTGSRYVGLNDLQGVHIIVGGSGNNPVATYAGTSGINNLSTNNGLNPDAIVLGGNFTTDDSYQGTFATTGGTCGGQLVTLTTLADAAVRRLVSGANATKSVQAAFTPVPGKKFAARVVDARGCQHFVIVCDAVATATGALISLAPDSSASGAVTDGAHTNCGARDTEPVTINPVQRVRWYLGANTDSALDPATGTESPTNKFNIYRDFLDADDTPVTIPGMRTIVAEYGVDLKFGITIADYNNQLQIYEMDTDAGGGSGNIDKWTKNASGTVSGQEAPQRVRSVRFRLATRAAVADRQGAFQPSPYTGPGLPTYLTRYCVQNTAAPSCTNFARLRTVVSEVTLVNQLGMTY